MIQSRIIPNLVQLATFLQNTPKLRLKTLKYEDYFRNKVDLKHVNDVCEKAISDKRKVNLVLIGVGESGIEPLGVLTQVYLSARKYNKNISDVLERCDFVDLDLPHNIKHSVDIVKNHAKYGVDKFFEFQNGLAEKESEKIYTIFKDYLNAAKNKYMGHSIEDFVDNKSNHNLYDLVFCNNVFYYVGRGIDKYGEKYSYFSPMNELYSKTTRGRYCEVMDNLLQVARKGGRVFFHHNADDGKNVINSEMKRYVIETKFGKFKEMKMDIYERV